MKIKLSALPVLVLMITIVTNSSLAQNRYQQLSKDDKKNALNLMQQFLDKFIEVKNIRSLPNELFVSESIACFYDKKCCNGKETLCLGNIMVDRSLVNNYPDEFRDLYADILNLYFLIVLYTPEIGSERLEKKIPPEEFAQLMQSINFNFSPNGIQSIEKLRETERIFKQKNLVIREFIDKHNAVLKPISKEIMDYLSQQLIEPSSFFYIQGGDKCIDTNADELQLFIPNFVFILKHSNGQYKIKCIYPKDFS